MEVNRQVSGQTAFKQSKYEYADIIRIKTKKGELLVIEEKDDYIIVSTKGHVTLEEIGPAFNPEFTRTKLKITRG